MTGKKELVSVRSIDEATDSNAAVRRETIGTMMNNVSQNKVALAVKNHQAYRDTKMKKPWSASCKPVATEKDESLRSQSQVDYSLSPSHASRILGPQPNYREHIISHD